MGLKEWVIGLLIFSMAVTSWVAFSNDVFTFYSVEIGDPEYQEVYDSIEINIEDQSNISSEMQENVESTQINPSFLDQVSLITDVIVTALKLPFTSIKAIFTTLNKIANLMGIPSFLLSGILAILSTTLSILVLGWIFGRRNK